MLKLIILHGITLILQLSAFISLARLVKNRETLKESEFSSLIIQAISAYALFSFFLSLHPAELVNRYALYGMFSIVLSLVWMGMFGRVRPFYADMIGLTKFMLGAGLITISIAFG
jgi:drug/metabolite transporter superfamily protein YnfA